MTTVWIPRDAGALALGADETANALLRAARAACAAIDLRRNGSRGLYWLEPLVEVDTATGRVAYGPVAAADAASLLATALTTGAAHPLRIGDPASLPYLATQQRLTSARLGLVGPASLESYRALGGYAGLDKALAMSPAAIVEAIITSGLRGRGGAAFPTGIKWRTVLTQAATQKYIACNVDEGDSGTFADRMLMEGDPFALIEGMTIAGIAVGATRGDIYLRIEYPHARLALERAGGRPQRRDVRH